MKIIEQNEQHLIIKDGMTNSLLFGLLFIIVGVFVLYKSAGRAVLLFVGACFVLVGLFMFFAATSYTVEIGGSQILYKKKRLLGTQIRSYNSADAVRVETKQRISYSSGSPRAGSNFSVPTPQLSYQSVLVFKDGQELALDNIHNATSWMGGMLMSVPNKEFVAAHAVADYLHVPFGDGRQTN